MTAAVHARQNIGPGLGASEVATAIGLHPFKSPLRLWQEKVGEVEEWEGNEFTEWGLLVEPALLAWYARTLEPGQSIYHPPSSVYHPTIPWARCTPDGIVQQWQPPVGTPEGQTCKFEKVDVHGVQAKNASFWSGKRWDKGPPDEVTIQCTWEMFVTGLHRVDVIAALGGMPPQCWTVHYDQAMADDLYAGAAKFWHLVETRTRPPIDASEDWRQHFSSLIKSEGLVVPSTPTTDDLAGKLHDARLAMKAAKREVETLKNELCGVMADADADALETHLGLVTWRPAKGQTSWKSVAEDLGKRLGLSTTDLESIADAKRGASTRKFNVPREWGEES